jgi:hypothetical protein
VTAAISRPQTPPRKAILWTGRVISALPALGLVMSAAMKLAHGPAAVAMFTNKLGYQESSLTGIGLLELACTALYLIPQTAFLGALLLTGYLGGAIATHVRIGEPFAVPLVLGILVWVGLYLRESRLKALAPIRTT